MKYRILLLAVIWNLVTCSPRSFDNPVDPDRSSQLGDVITSFSLPGIEPAGIDWYDNYLWLIDSNERFLHQINSETGSIIKNRKIDIQMPWGCTWSENRIWIGDLWSCILYELDPETGRFGRSFKLPANQIRGLKMDRDTLWASDSLKQEILAYSMETNSMVNKIKVSGTSLFGICLIDGVMWAVDRNSMSVIVIDTITGSKYFQFFTPAQTPNGLTFDGEHIWLSDASGMIYKIVYEPFKHGTSSSTKQTVGHKSRSLEKKISGNSVSDKSINIFPDK